MPGKNRPSSIPRRAIPKLKRNDPIPLRGTRSTQDTYTPMPARSRIPSANIPVRHSPAPSSRSSGSLASQSGRSANSSTDTTCDPYERVRKRESLSEEEGSEAASEIDDVALSPGFSRIMAMLEPEAGRDPGSGKRLSQPNEVDNTDIDAGRPLGMTGFLPGGMLSPFKIPGLDGSTSQLGSWGTDGISGRAQSLVSNDSLNMNGPKGARTNSSTSVDTSQIGTPSINTTTKADYGQLTGSTSNGPSGDSTGLVESLETPRASTWQTTSTSGETNGTYGESRDSVRSLAIQSRSPSNIIPTSTLPQSPSGPYAILRELETLLGPEIVAETIDVPRVLGVHDACPSPSTATNSPSVFGTSLCAAARYASCSTVLGGQTHMLPIVIFAAVEELYRAGLTSPRLLRPASTSNATTLPSLVAAFDTGPTYGDRIDLSRPLTPLDDVSALLLTYLDCLPGPIIVRSLLPALLRFCIHPQATPNMQAAQLLLRLLPPPHFSLLVYLLAFLAQIPRYKTVNGWNVKNVAGAFARVVCGSSVEGEGEDVLEWLVRNWDALSTGLFPGAIVPTDENDLGARITGLEQQHEAAVRAAYEAGAADERTMFAREIQALREAWEREGKILGGIVRRFAEGAPGAVSQ